jgi:uncharacterized protein YcnI
MTARTRNAVGTAVVACAMLIPAVVHGHVTIWPRQSAAGATEKYTVRVPTEGKVMTVGAELDAPEGVVIETVALPAGWTYELKRTGDRITGISWKMDIKPGEFAEFSFVARNPRDKEQLVWGLRQRFADGTVQDFTKGPNGTRPTAIVRLTPMTK